MERGSNTSTSALVVLAVLGVMAALHLMKVILVPVALALMLACLLSPFTRSLRRLLPLSATGAAVVLFLVLAAAGLLLAGLTAQGLVQAANTLPADADRLASTLSRSIAEMGRDKPFLRGVLPEPGTIDSLGDRNRLLLLTNLRERLADLTGWLFQGMMVLVLVLFLLAESDSLTPKVIRFFTPSPGDAWAAERTFTAVIRKIRAYLVARTLINLGLGLVMAVALWLKGVPFPIALGGVSALASFIPYVGQIAGGTLTILVCLAHSGLVSDALIVAAIYIGLVSIEGYIVTPYVMGRSLDLNGTTVLIACLLWGFLWGLVGLVLAMPITVSMKLIFQHIPALHRWADLMSRDWQTPGLAVAATCPEDPPPPRSTPKPDPSAQPRPDGPAPVEHPPRPATSPRG